MRVVIPDDYQNAVHGLACFSRLSAHDVTIFDDTVKGVDALAHRFADAEALVLIRERSAITAELLARLPRLELISQTGKGTAHIDVAACTRHGVAVAAGTGSPYAPAELTWALILAASRRIPQQVSSLRQGRWQTSLGTGLRGRTLAVWGYGKIGSLVAGFGRAFGMHVVIWGREGSLTRARADGYAIAQDKTVFCKEADVLTLHLRLNDETRGIVAATDLQNMKPDALVVNTSRAELIEQGALVAALQAGRPGLAAVDVYEDEPVIGGSHPLLDMDNVICTPHLGYVEKDSYELYFGQAFDHVIAFSRGQARNLVNPEVLSARRR